MSTPTDTPTTERRTHELKTWAEYFDAVQRGDKTFEVRRDDRGFRVGDRLVLRRWLEGAGCYDDVAPIRKRIAYVLPGGQFGIQPGYVVLGLGTS